MKKRTKTILLVVGIFVAGLAIAGYLYKLKLDADTKDITTAKQTETSKKINAIHESTDVADLTGKLGSEDATDRLAATKRLVQLAVEKNAEAEKALDTISKDDKQQKQVLVMVNGYFADKLLAGKQGAERIAAIEKMLTDPRAGLRLKGLMELGDGTAESKAFIEKNKALLKKLAKEDQSDLCRVQAESLAGGGEEETYDEEDYEVDLGDEEE